MRAYAKTPAGRASQKRSRANFLMKRGYADKLMTINHQPLTLVMKNWR